jgi:molecular chaperone GrpE
MSEQAPPGVPEGAAVPAEAGLTPEAVEAVLADFRAWLLQAVAAPAGNGEAVAAPPAGPAEAVDLHTLLGQFVALRHEVNLQTRATRAQQEQTAEALRQFGQAVALAQQRKEGPADPDEAVRPLLKVLLDLHDALSLAGRQVQRVESVLLPGLDQLATVAAPLLPAQAWPARTDVKLPFLLRLFGGRSVLEARAAADQAAQEEANEAARQQEAERRRQVEQAAARARELVGSVVTGYTMSVQRLERALQQYGLEPIPCIGRPFDPEVMEAVEVVAEPGRLSSEVTEEVRRGYLWRGRVFRYAQVKVARPER